MVSGETVALTNKTELNDDMNEVTSKEKEVDDELNDLFREIDYFLEDFPPTVVREVGLSGLENIEDARKRIKGKAVDELEGQLQPLKQKRVESSDELLFVDETVEEGIKRHDNIAGEWMQMEMIISLSKEY